MAKNKEEIQAGEAQRQSRKEVLLARRERERRRQIRLALTGVVALIGVVVVIAVVVEYFVRPGQPVANVNGEEITLSQWQARAQYARAQIIIRVENTVEDFGGDVGLVQQLFGNEMNILVNQPEALGESVLTQMTNDLLVQQEAEARGIVITEEDVDEAIEEGFSYFDGGLPTPAPTATQTPIATPSITPIPTDVITPGVPTNTPAPTPTLGPTNTPLPTQTPVSQESFTGLLTDTLGRLRSLGVGEETYRAVIRAQLYRERLTEVLVEEQGIAAEAEQASIFLLIFESREEAEEALAQIEANDFLTVWNTIRSDRQAGQQDGDSTAVASELVWRPRDGVESSVGPNVADAAFSLDVGATSDIIVEGEEEAAAEDQATPPGEPEATEPARFYILQVSGREVRPLPETAIETAEQQLLEDWLTSRQAGVEIFERWRARVPRQPVLNPDYLIPPTQPPATEPPPTVAVVVTPAATPGNE